MTAPGGFEIEEAEGADLGTVQLAGVRRECERCGRDSWTGRVCTACATAIQPLPAAYGLWAPRVGCEPPSPENGSERAEMVAPEMVCPVNCKHPPPAPVKDLAWAANVKAWTVRVRHSRGGAMGGAGKQLAAAELWSVRFRRGTWMGYAVRRGDSWESVCITGATLPPFLALGVTDLREWLSDPEGCGQQWCDAIRERVARQELHKKIVPCPSSCLPIGPWTEAGAPPASVTHTHRKSGAIVIKNSRKEAVSGA